MIDGEFLCSNFKLSTDQSVIDSAAIWHDQRSARVYYLHYCNRVYCFTMLLWYIIILCASSDFCKHRCHSSPDTQLITTAYIIMLWLRVVSHLINPINITNWGVVLCILFVSYYKKWLLCELVSYYTKVSYNIVYCPNN